MQQRLKTTNLKDIPGITFLFYRRNIFCRSRASEIKNTMFTFLRYFTIYPAKHYK